MYAFSVLVLSLAFLAVAELDGFYVKDTSNSDSDELPPVFALIDVAKPASNAYLTNVKTQLKRLAATLSPQQKLGIGTYSGSDQNPYVKEVVSLTMVSDGNVNWNASIDSLQLSQSSFRDVGAALSDVASVLAPFKNVGSVIFLTGVYSPYEGNNDEMDCLRLLLENNIRLATLQVLYTLKDLFLKRITLSSGGNYYTGTATTTSYYTDACNSVINLASSPLTVYKEVLEKKVDFTSDSNGSYALINPGPMSLVFQTNIIQNITLTVRSPADENYTPFNKTCNWNLHTYPTYQCKLGVWVVDIDYAEAGTWNYEIQCNSCSEDLATGQIDLIINPSLTTTTEKPTTTTTITTSISISTQDTPVTTTEAPIPSTEIPTSTSDSPTITTETSITSTNSPSISTETSITSTNSPSISTETSITSTTETSIASTTETSISSTSTITSAKTTTEITSTITSTYLPSTNSETPTTTTTTNLPPTASSETTTTTVNTESSTATTQAIVTVTESPTTINTGSFSESSTTSSPTETSTNPSTSSTADSSSTTSTPSTPTTQSPTFETTTIVSSSSTVSVATPSEPTPTEVSPTSPEPTGDTKPFTKSAAFIGGVTSGCILLVILIVLIVVCSKKRSNAGYTDMVGSPPQASTLDERPQTSWKAQTAAYQPYHPTRYDPDVKSTPLSVPNNDGYWNETFEEDGMTLTAL